MLLGSSSVLHLFVRENLNPSSQLFFACPGTSQRSFSLLMWLCSILEVALFVTLIVMQFNGNANAKELSQSLISGVSVILFIWLAYRAYRYIDW